MDGVATEAVYASFWQRLGAFVLDQLLIGGFAVISFGALAIAGGDPAGDPAAATLVGILVAAWLYSALLESSERQATFGKLLLRVKVTDLSGKRIDFGRASGRYFAEWLCVAALMAGYALALFTRRRQALHDLLAGTLVVREDAEPLAIAGRQRAAPMPLWSQAGALAVVLAALAASFTTVFVRFPSGRDAEVQRQIGEGLRLAHEFELAVDLHRLEYGQWPADLEALRMDDYTTGLVDQAQYVDRIEIVDGTVVVQFNDAAHEKLRNRRLALRPWLNEQEAIAWQCGHAEPPRAAWNNSAGPRGNGGSSRAVPTDLPDRDLPVTCRAGFTHHEWQ